VSLGSGEVGSELQLGDSEVGSSALLLLPRRGCGFKLGKSALSLKMLFS
jgi:hypothetical protein